MRIAVITSDHVRHRYVANRLAAAFDLRIVISEPKRHDPRTQSKTPAGFSLARRYFADREACEREMLASGESWDRGNIDKIVTVGDEGVNDADLVAEVKSADVQLIAVFGSSILRAPWLDAFGGKMVNLHLGLSPYYRGSATNFWAMFDERLDLVGATIHLIEAGVDSGAILRHSRPPIRPTDTPHSIGNRTIQCGAEALVQTLDEFGRREIEAVAQWDVPDARETRRADFGAAALEDLLRRFEQGMVKRYLTCSTEVRPAVRLVRAM